MSLGFAKEQAHGLPAVDAIVFRVPVGDRWLTKLPTEEDRLAVGLVREIEQARSQILHAHPDCIDLFKSVFGVLDGFFAFGPAARGGRDVDVETAGKKDPVTELLQLGLRGRSPVRSRLSAAEQGFQHRQKGLRFA